MTFAAILFYVFQLIVGLVIVNFITVWGYHFVFRKSMQSAATREMIWMLPACWPALIMCWWLFGLYENGLGVFSDPAHYWVWWMLVAALITFISGFWFARWNRSRLLSKNGQSA
uniref:hypothetical protein n=1 Tax=uncultured Erythrobacter sp. TaxID=263913 RepID=UPI00260A8063|nr:hypothetical protein [uncultured Erythrobacter sp.]